MIATTATSTTTNTTARLANADTDPASGSGVALPAWARSNAAAGIATPNDAPTWRRLLNTPDATPASAAGNSASAQTVLAVTPSASGPPPSTATSETTTKGVPASNVPISTPAIAVTTRLPIIVRSGPSEAMIRLARGNTKAEMSGHGVRTRAAWNASSPRTVWR